MRILSVGAALLLSLPLSVAAQEPKFEAGVHFSALPSTSSTNPGFGGHVGYNLHRHAAVELELNLYPSENRGRGNLFDGLIGPKVGYRGSRLGIFGKARPGFFRYGAVPTISVGPRPVIPGVVTGLPIRQVEFTQPIKFAFDAGTVVEVYPTDRTVVRVDMGDTIIRRPDRFPIELAIPGTGQSPLIFPGAFAEQPGYSHNFQFNVGLAFRF